MEKNNNRITAYACMGHFKAVDKGELGGGGGGGGGDIDIFKGGLRSPYKLRVIKLR